MKLKNIFNTLSLAAVALIATACQDTDAQVEIADVDAPQFVAATLAAEKPVFFGETTVYVEFDKNIGFATKNASQITLNGAPVSVAKVAGISNALTVTSYNLEFSNTLTLHIPAGLIVGPQKKTYDQAIDQTWSTPEMPSNTATAMTKKLGWGWNLGNHFDTSGDAIKNGWGYWDQATPSAALFSTLANAGAATVRIPTTWTDHMDASNTIDAAYLDEVKGVVDLAIAAGLNVVLNTHHDSFETDLGNAATSEETAKADSTLIADLWTQVANKFADYDENVIFETFNEVHAGDNWGGGTDAEYALLNAWNQYAVDAIRKTGGKNATRWIGVSGYAANIDLTIAHFVLPTDAANRIMVGVHCYDPYNFCLNPYTTGDEVSTWGHTANGTSDEESYVINQLYKLRSTYIANDIPCYLGEYGCVWKNTDAENAYRAYYLEFFCRAANLAGIPMFIWDNNSKTTGNEACGYIDHESGAWLNDSETMVPTMIKACTSTDSSYNFQTIWDKAPVAE